MLGLVLGAALGLGGLPREELLGEGLTAGAVSVVWFAAYAVLDRVAWPPRLRAVALAAGVAALLLTLTVTPGIGFPSVATLLWAAVALALNSAAPRALSRPGGSVFARVLPLPLLAVAALLYFQFLFLPVTGGAGWASRALARWERFRADQAKEPGDRGIPAPETYFASHVVAPLRQAVVADPGNARLWALLANADAELWTRTVAGKDEGALRLRIERDLARVGLDAAGRAIRLDPAGAAGYEARHDLLRRFGEHSAARAGQEKDRKAAEKLRESARDQFVRAARSLEAFLKHDPTDAPLRYRVAEALFRAGNEAEGRRQAGEAARLDRLATSPPRRLTDEQRQNVRRWLGPRTGS